MNENYIINENKHIIVENSMSELKNAGILQFHVEKVTISPNVKTIPRYSFYLLSSLKEIIFPDNIAEIEDNAIYMCSSLVKLTIPSRFSSQEQLNRIGIKNPEKILLKASAACSNSSNIRNSIPETNILQRLDNPDLSNLNSKLSNEQRISNLEVVFRDMCTKLQYTEAELITTKNKLASTEAKLASTEAKLEDTENRLAITQADLRMEKEDNIENKKLLFEVIDSLRKTDARLTDTTTRLYKANARIDELQEDKRLRRIVLAIGNSDYGNKAKKLDAAVRDAEAVADGFAKYGFATVCHKNLNKEDMKKAINTFYDQIKSAKTRIGIIYFSGHGGVFKYKRNGQRYKQEALYSCDGKPVFLSDVMRVDEELPSKKLYYIVDACHTEVLDDEKEKSVVNNELIYNTIRAPKNRTIAFSSQYNEVSEIKGVYSDYTQKLIELLNHGPFMFEINASPAKLLRHTASMLWENKIGSQSISYGNNEIAQYADKSAAFGGGCITRRYEDICSSYSNSMSSSANSNGSCHSEDSEREAVRFDEFAVKKVEKTKATPRREISNSFELKK